MNPLLLSFIVSTALTGVGIFVQRNSRSAKIDAAIQEWAPIVFDVVNNIVQQNTNHPANKMGIFTKEFAEVMTARGIKVTPDILTQARAIASSLHYQDKRSQEVLTQARDIADSLHYQNKRGQNKRGQRQIQQQTEPIGPFPPTPVPAKTAPTFPTAG